MALPRNGWVQPIEGVAGGVPVPVTPGTNGAFDSGNVDETTLVQWVRAAITGLDQTKAAGSQNIPVEARSLGIAGFSENLNKLFVIASLAAIDNTQPGGSRGAQLEAESSANATSLSSGFRNRLFVDALVRGHDGAGTQQDQWVNADLYTNVSGRSTTNLGGLYAVAVAAGFDNTGAQVLRPVEARSLSGWDGSGTSLLTLGVTANVFARDVSDSLQHLIMADLASNISGRATGTPRAIYAAAIATGIDNTGAAVLRPVEARSGANWDASATTLIELGVAANIFGKNGGSSSLQQVYADAISNVSGRGTGAIGGLYANAITLGVDNTGAAVLRPVEARSNNNFDTTAATVVALATLSSDFVFDGVNSQIRRVLGVREITGVGSGVLKGVLEARQNGYWGAVQSRRYTAKHATEGGNVTAQASYVATTPTIMLANAAAAVRAIMRTFYTGIDSATTNPVRVVIKIDSADRRSVAGTAITAQNTNSGGGATAVTSWQENPTATAEGGGTKRLYEFIIPSGKGASITINLNDEDIVGLTGSWLVYVFDDAGLVAPSILWWAAYEEAA